MGPRLPAQADLSKLGLWRWLWPRGQVPRTLYLQPWEGQGEDGAGPCLVTTRPPKRFKSWMVC